MPSRAKPLPARPTPNDRAKGYREEQRKSPDGRGLVTVRRIVITLECPNHPGRPYRYDAFDDAPACPFCETGRA
jgi:hypothetical protein